MDIFCKVAIVTGGGSGIGYASAYELLNNGAKVTLSFSLNMNDIFCKCPSIFVGKISLPSINAVFLLGSYSLIYLVYLKNC